jgi:hypothetical protein
MRWQAAKCFLVSMLRAEPGGWHWTFVPLSSHQAPAFPRVFGILSSVSVIVDSLVESGEFYSTEMAEDSAQVQTTT